MPIYDYKCGSCDAKMEFFHPMSEIRKKCPECGKMKLKRQLSIPVFHDRYSPMHPRAGRGRGGAHGLPRT